MQVVRAGLTFDVRDEGRRDGEPVVMLHGFPQTSTIWSPLAVRLHAAGYRTLAPDQRGYSPGARPLGIREYALPELVADALAVLDAATDGRAHLVAHDWGAGVAWALAARHPDRVATLTALSSPPRRRSCGTSAAPPGPRGVVHRGDRDPRAGRTGARPAAVPARPAAGNAAG